MIENLLYPKSLPLLKYPVRVRLASTFRSRRACPWSLTKGRVTVESANTFPPSDIMLHSACLDPCSNFRTATHVMVSFTCNQVQGGSISKYSIIKLVVFVDRSHSTVDTTVNYSYLLLTCRATYLTIATDQFFAGISKGCSPTFNKHIQGPHPGITILKKVLNVLRTFKTS
jgi:hypothetical protein